MLECAAKFSPRIEEAGQGAGTGEAGGGTACAFVLDIAGTERLFGRSEQLAERLREELAGAGFRASIAVSANYDAARMKAAGIHGIAVIAEGAEAGALEKLPITALGLDEEYAATFALWGIGTLGELAALPEADLVARIGPKARVWRALARGEAEHTFEPIEAEFSLEEFCEFETPVEQIDSLLFVGARMIDCLVTRAAGRALALRTLTAEMGLEGGGTHCGTIRPAVPSTDRKFLLKLLQLEIGAHPPQAAVVRLTLRAEAGAQGKVQLGLFAPQTPEPSRLDVTLARLRAMVGEERVGSPVLEDTHRAGGFRMEGFAASGGSEAEIEATPRMALRRVRPARLVRVTVRAAKPAVFRDQENSYEIAAAYGPWRTSGCWWALKSCDGAWDCEEWDVLAVRVEKLPSGAKAPAYLADHTARLKPCPFKASSLPSGAEAQDHFASDTAVGDESPTYQPCPDTKLADDHFADDEEASVSDSSKTNVPPAGERQPQILRLGPAVRGFAQDDKHSMGFTRTQDHFASDTAVGDESPTYQPCPDTKLADDHFADDEEASVSDSSKTNVPPAGERQPQILRLRPAVQGSVQDDKHSMGFTRTQDHFASDTAVGDESPTYQPCPDTKLADDHFADDEEASVSDSSKTNVPPAGERQPQILRPRPAVQGSVQDDKQETFAEVSEGAKVACLLTRDRTRNTWRLEAFYD